MLWSSDSTATPWQQFDLMLQTDSQHNTRTGHCHVRVCGIWEHACGQLRVTAVMYKWVTADEWVAALFQALVMGHDCQPGQRGTQWVA